MSEEQTVWISEGECCDECGWLLGYFGECTNPACPLWAGTRKGERFETMENEPINTPRPTPKRGNIISAHLLVDRREPERWSIDYHPGCDCYNCKAYRAWLEARKAQGQ